MTMTTDTEQDQQTAHEIERLRWAAKAGHAGHHSLPYDMLIALNLQTGTWQPPNEEVRQRLEDLLTDMRTPGTAAYDVLALLMATEGWDWAEVEGEWQRLKRTRLRDEIAPVAPFNPDGIVTEYDEEAIASPPLWGKPGEKHLVLAHGRPSLVFGRDGSGKTNLVGLIAAGALGLPGFGELLGYPVQPLPDDEAVLMLALDGSAEVVDSFARFGLTPDTDRFTLWGQSLPEPPDTANALTLTRFVAQVEQYTGLRYGLVILDNGHLAFGDIASGSPATRADALMNAAVRLGNEGRAVIVITQAKQGKPTHYEHALWAAAGHLGLGGSLSVHKLAEGSMDGSKPMQVELRHYKGIGAGDGARTVEVDLPSGRWALAGVTDRAMQHASWLAVLPTVFTADDAAKAWGLKKPHARMQELADYKQVHDTGQKIGQAHVWAKGAEPTT